MEIWGEGWVPLITVPAVITCIFLLVWLESSTKASRRRRHLRIDR